MARSRISGWMASGLIAVLLGSAACSGASGPPVGAMAPAVAQLRLGATAVTLLAADGTVTGRQINLSWRNLPADTTAVSVERAAAGGGAAKRVQLQGAAAAYADTDVAAGTDYRYTVTALDGAGRTLGNGLIEGARVAAPRDVTLPGITTPADSSDVNPAEAVLLAWPAPDPAPEYLYLQVANAFTGQLVTAFLLDGRAAGATVRTQRSTTPQTESVLGAELIAHLQDVLPIRTQGALEEALSYRVTLSALRSDVTPLAAAREITIRQGASVTFTLPAFAAYFMGA